MKGLLLLCFIVSTSLLAQVTVEPVPESGLQPQVAADEQGGIHLVYLTGDVKHGNEVRYTYRAAGASQWQPSLAVNSSPGSAIAMGTIRGARLALGKQGSVHVVWNGRAVSGKHRAAPLYYARLSKGESAFSEQLNLLSGTEALDGGADVTADDQGRVSVVWHGQSGAEGDEGTRLLFARHSKEDGRSFGPLLTLNASSPGVCACCSLSCRLLADGSLGVLYRGAPQPDQRGMIWLTQAPGVTASTLAALDEWTLQACPMSSAVIAGEAEPLLAWENAGRIILSAYPHRRTHALDLVKARHPALARNTKGAVLVACSGGAAWAKAGKLQWALLEADLTSTLHKETDAGPLPVWSYPAAFAQKDGSFVILR